MKIIKISLKIFLILILTSLTCLGVISYLLIKDLPPLEEIVNIPISQSTKIYDRTGKILLYEIHRQEKRTIVPKQLIPEHLKLATIAIEDDDFYQHPAIDFKAILRSVYQNIIKGKVTQGGSTITQQLVKNLFLTPERTIWRKLKEIILAFQLEHFYDKDEILALYLNQIYYGANCYGVAEAAKAYFGKPVGQLNLAESAILASLPKAPSYYSPWGSHQDKLFLRQKFILKKMYQLGFISQQEFETAKQTKISFASPKREIKAPHLVMEVKKYLENKYGQEVVEKGGLKVITTLDYNLQKIAEQVVKEGVKRNQELYGGKNAALVAQDVKTGEVLALVGSRDYFDIENQGNFNVATQGLRQPGSAIKPFVYVTAFQQGYTPDTIVFDVPTEFDTTGKKSYQPKNFDNYFRGPVTLKEALAQSINVPSVKILYLAGIKNSIETARKAGITTFTEPNKYGLSLVLGGAEVKLIELVSAYTVFANQGIKTSSSLILRVEDSQGRILEQYQPDKQRVIQVKYANWINYILSDPYLRTPLFSRHLDLTIFPDHRVALKTGTTNDYRDAWCIGYTPSIVVGVWAGNNDYTPLKKQGSSILAALPIWHEFMKQVLPHQPKLSFPKPEFDFSTKPILRGEIPQLHSILYYVNKNNPRGPAPEDPTKDPQFENWEQGVQEWAKENASNLSIYNQIQKPKKLEIKIENFSLKNGEFISFPLLISADLKSEVKLKKVELLLNNQLLNSKLLDTKSTHYKYKIRDPEVFELQNLVELRVTDKLGNTKTIKVIVFKKQNSK